MNIKLTQIPEVAVLAGMALIGIVVLAATSHPIDPTLNQLALVLGGGAAGIAVNPKILAPAPPA